MLSSRFGAASFSLCAILVLICQSATAQTLQRQARPVVLAAPPAPPSAWVFADIHVTVQTPTSVKVEWQPYPEGIEYHVKRNGGEIGSFTSAPTETRAGTFLDGNAPPGSTLVYSVLVRYNGLIYNTSGAAFPGLLSKESNPVTVTTPLDPVRVSRPVLAPPRVLPPSTGLKGWVDLHAHPMSYLGFGGKLLYGAVDDQALRPPTPNCISRGPLSNENDWYGAPLPALGGSACGNGARAAIIGVIESPAGLSSFPYPPVSYLASGPPAFLSWPAWNDVLRQKMWWEWMYRAYQGGQRVMVALAVNNKLLGDVILGVNTSTLGLNASPDLPTTDKESADLQIQELKKFVQRNDTWMRIAHSSAELHDIVAGDPSRNIPSKMAVVIGMEIDNIGNLVGNVPPQVLNAEIDRLYLQDDVRYIFPVHLVNNPIGKTAVYEDMFLIANAYEEHAMINLMCVQGQQITYQYSSTDNRVAMIMNSGLQGLSLPQPKPCDGQNGWGNVNAGELHPDGNPIFDSTGRPVGLSAAGAQAIQHMMDLGMLIDIDHMSGASVDGTLSIAASNKPVPYPLFSGHNNLRGSAGPGSFKERQLTRPQYTELFARHGMAGIGAASSGADLWLSSVQLTLTQAGALGRPVAFGTDADGMEFMMPPRPRGSGSPSGSNINLVNQLPFPAVRLPPASTGTKTWDYNRDGVAHYGLLPDFLLDVQSLPGGPAVVDQMFGGAEYFYQTWALAERDIVKGCPDVAVFNKQTQSCACPAPSQMMPASSGSYCGCPAAGTFFNTQNGQCQLPLACPPGKHVANALHPFSCADNGPGATNCGTTSAGKPGTCK